VSHELEHLTLLAEVDALLAAIKAWHDREVPWAAARECRTLVGRLLQRTESVRVRIEAPLVVATLGGTGVGKSTLVNALAGDDVSQASRERPTTRQPTFIARPGVTPDLLGIDPAAVRTVHRDLPLLQHLVLVDCPDPDTTEDESAGDTNLARLRDLLPHCDVLLVVSTQQKYRSARVSEELRAAAAGARLVFVQTHADQDDDVRDDWRRVLNDDFSAGEMFFVDAPAALAATRLGKVPTGEFGRLVDFLTRQLAGTAAARIRRANVLDLIDETLARCNARYEPALAPLAPLEQAVREQRAKLGAQLVDRVATELHGNRRLWEERLVEAVTARWGLSPFSLVLRGYQALGGIASGWGLTRVRTPAQMALWGAFEGARRWQRSRRRRGEETAAERGAALAWNESDLRTAAIVVDGYVAEADLPRSDARFEAIAEQAAVAADEFVDRASAALQSAVDQLAVRHAGRGTRWWYETLLLVPLAALVYRFLKNFLYDSWLVEEFGLGAAKPLYGLEFFLAAGLTVTAWCGLLLWSFTTRLKRGLDREIDAFRDRLSGAAAVPALFAPIERQCRTLLEDDAKLTALRTRAEELRSRLATGDGALGHRR
jgi:energy-coupling factor transporter ATP-binding protein EcfA2